MTGRSLIRRALRTLGVTDPGENISPVEVQDNMDLLRSMLNTWRTQRLLCYVVRIETFELVANQQTYTLGPGGDFEYAVRPVFIDRIGAVQNVGSVNELELPLYVLRAAQDWQAILNKLTQSAWPIKVYVTMDFPLITLTYWPVPNGGLALSTRIYTYVSIDGLQDASTEYEFAPGYEEALVYNLALRMAPEYGVAATDLVRDLAASRMADVKRTNVAYDRLVLDPALPGRQRRHYNYMTDQYQR